MTPVRVYLVYQRVHSFFLSSPGLLFNLPHVWILHSMEYIYQSNSLHQQVRGLYCDMEGQKLPNTLSSTLVKRASSGSPSGSATWKVPAGAKNRVVSCLDAAAARSGGATMRSLGLHQVTVAFIQKIAVRG